MDGQLEGYLIALQGSTHHALDVAINRVIRGEIEAISKKFCPTAPELSSIIRTEMEFISNQIELAKNRLLLESTKNSRNASAPRLTYAERVAAARQRMVDEGRKELFEVKSNEEFMRLRKKIPTGGIYVNLLDAAFGPPGSLHFKLEPRQPAPQPAPEMADIEF